MSTLNLMGRDVPFTVHSPQYIKFHNPITLPLYPDLCKSLFICISRYLPIKYCYHSLLRPSIRWRNCRPSLTSIFIRRAKGVEAKHPLEEIVCRQQFLGKISVFIRKITANQFFTERCIAIFIASVPSTC